MGRNHSEIVRLALGFEDYGSTDIRAGYDAAADATSSAIWDKSAVRAYPATASVMKVSSSSTADTSAGTGAQTVLLTGLDAGYNIVEEAVSLAGQTAVNSENTYIRIHDLRVLTVGSGLLNAGNLYVGTGTVTAGVPANVYEFAKIAVCRSRSCAYTVPVGYNGLMTQIEVAAERNASIKFTMNVRLDGGPWVEEAKLPVFEGTEIFPLTIPFVIPEKADIELRAEGTGEVNGRFDMIILKS